MKMQELIHNFPLLFTVKLVIMTKIYFNVFMGRFQRKVAFPFILMSFRRIRASHTPKLKYSHLFV